MVIARQPFCWKWISVTKVSKYGKSEYSRALNASYTFQPLMSFWCILMTAHLTDVRSYPRVVCLFVFNFKISVQEYNLLRTTYGNRFCHFHNSTLFYGHVWGIHCWACCMWFSICYRGSYRDIYSQSVSHSTRCDRHQYLKNIAEIIAISFYNLTTEILPTPFPQ